MQRYRYGHSLSTVFGPAEKGALQEFDEDDDPVIMQLSHFDYRYVRFFFHPLNDEFVLCSHLKDPVWTDMKSIRAGLDGDEKQRKAQVFGKNQIDVQQKSVLQLLVDEVSAEPRL